MSINKSLRTSKPMLLGGACLLLLMQNPALAISTWNIGDLFLGVANGLYQVRDQAGALKETLKTGRGGFTTGCAFDANFNLYVTEFSVNRVSVFGGQGGQNRARWPKQGSSDIVASRRPVRSSPAC